MDSQKDPHNLAEQEEHASTALQPYITSPQPLLQQKQDVGSKTTIATNVPPSMVIESKNSAFHFTNHPAFSGSTQKLESEDEEENLPPIETVAILSSQRPLPEFGAPSALLPPANATAKPSATRGGKCKRCRKCLAKRNVEFLGLCTPCFEEHRETGGAETGFNIPSHRLCRTKCGKTAKQDPKYSGLCGSCFKSAHSQTDSSAVRLPTPGSFPQQSQEGVAKETQQQDQSRVSLEVALQAPQQPQQVIDPNLQDPMEVFFDHAWQALIVEVSHRIREIKKSARLSLLEAARGYIRGRRQAVMQLNSSDVEDIDGSLHAQLYGEIRIAQLYVMRKEQGGDKPLRL